MKKLLFAALLLFGSAVAQAELWTGILDTNRAIDWTTAGATITAHTTQCGSTISAYSGTSGTIQTAIDACTSGQHVQLGTGTFTLSTGWRLATGVVVRGNGASSTIVIFTGSYSGCIYSAVICVQGGGGNYTPSPDNTATWSAGYSKGTTVVTLSSTTNLAVGSLLFLDQKDDTSDATGIYECGVIGATCSLEGVTAFSRDSGTRNVVQGVRVTAINGSDITITPGVYMPTIRSGQTPGAWWNSTLPVTDCGVEALSMDTAASGVDKIILVTNARNCWVKGVRIVGIDAVTDARAYMFTMGAVHTTFRDNYVYGSRTGASQHYGIEIDLASDMLIENNIFESIAIPMTSGTGSQGIVWGYNYCFSNMYDTNWMQACGYSHAIGNSYHLFEGNDTQGFTADAIHGSSCCSTFFRNHMVGWDPYGGSSTPVTVGKTAQTIPIHIYAYNRYYNFIGNVLGRSALHTNYEGYATSTSNSDANPDVSIYMLGYSGNQAQGVTDPGGTPVNNDFSSSVNKTRSTMMRWGNWDTVNNATQWTSGEVPSGDAFYPNSVPASQTLPASFYLSSKPSFFGSVPWPAMGPDVSSCTNSVSDAGGHVCKIQARLCYESLSYDGNYTGSTVRTFDTGTCYAALLGKPTNTRFRPVRWIGVEVY